MYCMHIRISKLPGLLIFSSYFNFINSCYVNVKTVTFTNVSISYYLFL